MTKLTMLNGLVGAITVVWMASDSRARVQAEAESPEGSEPAAISPEELEQLVAPIALYPDSLVSQILMAATYPLEVVQAERWAKQQENLKEDALAAALEKESWDPSVKSLVNFPQVLTMMSEELDWTTKLGDAFLAGQKPVMDAIQKLRGKAKSEGNLQTTKEQTVVVKEEAQTQVIVIESSDPEVVYVPSYNPTVVYGAWPYPASPPYSYYPPGYAVAGAALSFGVGVACGAAWGYAWGGCNWGGGDVDIDVDRNSFRNTNIDRSRYKSEIGSRNRNVQNGRGSWQHDGAHRKGTPYRDQNSARKYGGTSAGDAAKSRDSYRGKAETGRQDIARGGADHAKGATPGDGAGRAQGDRGSATNRNTPADRSGAGAKNSGSGSGSRGGAFDGGGQGSNARSDSQRGQASRSGSSSAGSRSSASRGSGGGASRGGGGGGSRGGGGGGGGRGGGGGGRGPGYRVEWF